MQRTDSVFGGGAKGSQGDRRLPAVVRVWMAQGFDQSGHDEVRPLMNVAEGPPGFPAHFAVGVF